MTFPLPDFSKVGEGRTKNSSNRFFLILNQSVVVRSIRQLSLKMLSAQTKDEMKLSSTAALLDTTETPASRALSSAVAGRASACRAPATELSHHNGCKCARDNYQTALLLSLLRLFCCKTKRARVRNLRQNKTIIFEIRALVITQTDSDFGSISSEIPRK